MYKDKAIGKVRTVRGLLESDRLGFTLAHEHLLSDFRCLIPESEWDSSAGSDLLKDDVDSLIKEATAFKDLGGGTIVDVTPMPNSGRNPGGLVAVAEESGINIIMGVSFYTEPMYTPALGMDRKTVEQVAELYIDEIEHGVGNTGIKPGIIGEAGCSWPLTSNERKCLLAAAIAQLETGLAISIHPGNDVHSPMQIVDILTAAGVSPGRIILGHIECACPPEAREVRRALAERGCYLEFDTFAVPEDALPPSARGLGDMGRIQQIVELVKEGLATQVLVSHDSLLVSLMSIHGGPGVIHIPGTVVPKMRSKGLSEQQIHAIMVDNPARVLQIQ
jgi:phosphotriesterase-related protein